MSTVCTLITGAADGLGRSFVHGCAARGHNIIMVAPPGSKLMLLGAHFEKHFGIKCYGIEVDICQNGSIDEICSFLDRHQLDVNVLINNAGIEHLQAFEELSPEFLQTQFAINMICPAMLIHRLLPMLKQTAPSHIINIGSMSCLSASPGPKHYASEKSFLTHLSLSLREELSKYNIHVSIICPALKASNAYRYVHCASSNKMTRVSTLHPDEVAEYGLKKSLKGKTVIIPGLANRVELFFSKLLPGWVWNTSTGRKKRKAPHTFTPTGVLCK